MTVEHRLTFAKKLRPQRRHIHISVGQYCGRWHHREKPLVLLSYFAVHHSPAILAQLFPQRRRVGPRLIKLALSAQPDVLLRCSGAKEFGIHALTGIGVIKKQDEIT